MINQLWNNVTYYFRCFNKNNKPDYIKCMYNSTYNDENDDDDENDDENETIGMELEYGRIHPSQFPTFACVMSRD
jgi:hypothetical protein